MIKFIKNEYIELYNILTGKYFLVRILNVNQNGYKIKILSKNKIIDIYDDRIRNDNCRKLNISKRLLEKIGFQHDNFIYKFKDTFIYEAMFGNLEINKPYKIYEYKSKHLGYYLLNNNELEDLNIILKDISILKSKYTDFKKLKRIYSVNDIIQVLVEKYQDELNYETIDKKICE